jgi:hypothetical protein
MEDEILGPIGLTVQERNSAHNDFVPRGGMSWTAWRGCVCAPENSEEIIPKGFRILYEREKENVWASESESHGVSGIQDSKCRPPSAANARHTLCAAQPNSTSS